MSLKSMLDSHVSTRKCPAFSRQGRCTVANMSRHECGPILGYASRPRRGDSSARWSAEAGFENYQNLHGVRRLSASSLPSKCISGALVADLTPISTRNSSIAWTPEHQVCHYGASWNLPSSLSWPKFCMVLPDSHKARDLCCCMSPFVSCCITPPHLSLLSKRSRLYLYFLHRASPN